MRLKWSPHLTLVLALLTNINLLQQQKKGNYPVQKRHQSPLQSLMKLCLLFRALSRGALRKALIGIRSLPVASYITVVFV